MTFGYGRRRSRRPGSTISLPAWAARVLREAEGLGTVEWRRRGGLEFRLPAGSWQPIAAIEEAVAIRRGPIQLAAFDAAEDKNR